MKHQRLQCRMEKHIVTSYHTYDNVIQCILIWNQLCRSEWFERKYHFSLRYSLCFTAWNEIQQPTSVYVEFGIFLVFCVLCSNLFRASAPTLALPSNLQTSPATLRMLNSSLSISPIFLFFSSIPFVCNFTWHIRQFNMKRCVFFVWLVSLSLLYWIVSKCRALSLSLTLSRNYSTTFIRNKVFFPTYSRSFAFSGAFFIKPPLVRFPRIHFNFYR